ncbi:hypothetical protein SAMN04487996_122164 [Dyadobacter soli]|uniref:Uncharacterized protein n=1 Tax=Dyadobacter soli TaxID=659014 RepID=A0A1G7WVP6_9BACT|nr:hypothetical protein [Dyadobacter soli]SDG75340.1 hypothetical protein SAMN04487996_122164 [Dyadobacter soli]
MTLPDIPILSTAIAIVISWALYALFCSYFLEAWVQIKAERGRFMKSYMYQQLMDNINGINWADMIYSHGTIDLLSRDPKKPSNDISPKLFAETLVEVVGGSHLVQSRIRTYEGPTVAYDSPLLRNFKYGTLLLNTSDLVSLFRQAMNYAELKAKKDAVGKSNEEEVHDYLAGYFENWFTEFSQRLTLWYKKRTRERLFFLGAVMAVLINVDSLQLFSFYENNPKAAAAVIRFYKEHPKLASDSLSLNEIKASKEKIPASKPDLKILDSLIRISQLRCEIQIELMISLRQEIRSPNRIYLDSIHNTIGRSGLPCNVKLKLQHVLLDANKIPDPTMVQLVNKIIDSSANRTIVDSMKLAFADQMVSKLKNKNTEIVDNLVRLSEMVDDDKDYFGHLLKLKSNPAQNILTNSLDSLIRETKLPVGFQYSIFKDKTFARQARSDWYIALIKIAGVLISGFAASFGAPFWFDLLKKATSKP